MSRTLPAHLRQRGVGAVFDDFANWFRKNPPPLRPRPSSLDFSAVTVATPFKAFPAFQAARRGRVRERWLPNG